MRKITCLAGISLLALACRPADVDARPETDNPHPQRRHEKPPTRLDIIQVNAQAAGLDPEATPATHRRITASQIATRINAIDAEDVLKYVPSLMVRKRHIGDTQAVLATRTWGVNSSARSLIYVDGVLISALIANDNTSGGPRWGMVNTQDIDHVDVSYGPFSAAYPGNAMGAVVNISTRIPDHASVSIEESMGLQDYSQYQTHGQYFSNRTAASVSNKQGRSSWQLSADSENSFSQPLTYITSSSQPAGTHGAIPAFNKLGQSADVLGAGGLLHTRMTHLGGRVNVDLGHGWSLSYLLGYWQNHGRSQTQSYLTSSTGAATYGGAAGFASSSYWQSAQHLMQAINLGSDTHGDWDGSLVITQYRYMTDLQSAPAGVSGDSLLPQGHLADSHGTGWYTVDLQGIWRPQGYLGGQEVSAGLHLDHYRLDSPTYTTADWTSAGPSTGLYSLGRGQTQTEAVWLQDRWAWSPSWQLTLGGRWEHWTARDGMDALNGQLYSQPDQARHAFSPKASLQWQPASRWTLHASLAKATRFPTVSELYQLVSTGDTYTRPNANLKPERVTSSELGAAFQHAGGSVRLTLFNELTHQALISQTELLAGYAVPVTFVDNVDRIRNRGIELEILQEQTAIRGLSLTASTTFVDSTILSDPSFASTTGSSADGRHVPYVPRWRATVTATYQPGTRWSLTVAGRYSGKQYSTLDNSDQTSGVFGAFDSYTVFDLKANWQLDRRLKLSAGIDNIGGRRYFLYHPFPMRSYMLSLRYQF
ncbi:TonB-dependent receptor [Frateuria aurantia]